MLKTGNAEQEIQRLFPEMTAWRRHLHRHPELSFQERETSAWIASRLREFGCDEVTEGVGGHGVVAVIRGALPGPSVALRADIDALPIQDEKETEYRSAAPGVMHACGHDGHTAALLGVAAYYCGERERLAGERRLLFQPAEEVSPGGAMPMIADGALDGIDAVYGVHLWSSLPYGTVAGKGGPFMAAADEFTVEIAGKGGHGALPHQTVDAVVVGAALVQALQTIVSRSVNPLGPAVVTVGSIHAGTTANVIAERCQLKGTVRAFDESVRAAIKERLKTIVAQTCALFGAAGTLDYRDGYPAVVNDEAEAARFRRVAAELFGQQAVRTMAPIMAGEDFAYYLQRVPGCFMFVGSGGGGHNEYPHHHARFDIDERAMPISARLLIGIADDYAASSFTAAQAIDSAGS